MTQADIVEAVYLSCADTYMAWAFRRAVGCPGPAPKTGWSVRGGGVYDGMAEAFANRRRVRL